MTKSKFEYVSAGNYLYLSVLRLWAGVAAFFFFRKLKAVGRHKIPTDVPVIFCANHQSAFLDPVLIGITCGRKPWYITRAGVFKGNMVKFLLRSLHMMPIYRPRDKVNIVEANTDTFDACEKILKGNGSLVVFVEGNHDMRKRLRIPLRKGFARMALGASTFANPVWIVPVGLTYEDPVHPRGDLLIQYGEPFSVHEYYSQFQDNPADGLVSLTRQLESRLHPLVLDIADPARYDDIEQAWHTGRSVIRDPLKRFTEDTQKIECLINHAPVAHAVRKRKAWKTFLLKVASAPLILAGLILNFPLYMLTKLLIHRFVRDPHFDQSIKFACGMGGAVIFGVFNFIMIYGLSGDMLLAVFTAVIGSFLGVIAYDLYADLWRSDRYIPTSERIKFRHKKSR